MIVEVILRDRTVVETFSGFVLPAGGGTETVTLTAGEDISALKIVRQNGEVAFLADRTDARELLDSIAGIALNGASLGGAVQVRRSGYVEDGAWNWAIGRVWLGVNGQLTQTPPVAGSLVVIGSAVSPTKILLSINAPIGLGV